jgi:hypothetical protein
MAGLVPAIHVFYNQQQQSRRIRSGYVRLRDIFNKRHITGFCLKFNKRDNRFLSDGDANYNYTREEKP